MKSKTLIAGLMFFLCIGSLSIKANEQPQDLFVNEETEIETIVIEGKINHLLKQYVNSESALVEAKSKYSEVFEYIKEQYHLSDISHDNFKDYQEKINIAFGNNEINEKYYYPVLAFFDIYENTDENLEVKSIVKNHNLNKRNLNENESDITETLIDLLTMSNPYVDDHHVTSETRIAEYNAISNNSDPNEPELSTFTYAKFAAIAYAEYYSEHASESNYPYYNGADCTNFVSQVAFNGGKMYIQPNPGNKEIGWWHTPLMQGVTQAESISWIRADRFVKFWGTQLETTSFRTFSATVRSGDYISVDMGDDGKWDHCGFVTDWNNTEKTYNYTFPNSSSTITMKYHDFKIAQHTSDTHDWVSSSRINWAAAGPEAASRGRYALVKRSNFVNGQN